MSGSGMKPRSLARQETAEHVLEDPAVLEVLDLLGGVDPHPGGELLVVRADGDLLGLAALDAGDGELLLAGQAERLGGVPILELQRQDAHSHEVRAVDTLVGLGDHRAHAEQPRALGRPVARGT